MTWTSGTKTLQELIPKTLDEVIQANRDRCQLALATDRELDALASDIEDTGCRHTLTHWQIVVIHITARDGTRAASPRLVGRVLETNQPWMTSEIMGIDAAKGLVRTANSNYRVVGPRVEERELDLMHICATLNAWGVGPLLGVPPFFY